MSVRSVVPTIAGGQFLRRRGVREIALIGALYLFYCVTRTFAEDDLGPAQDRAGDLLHLERVLHLDWEHAINNWFVAHPAVGGPGLLLVRRRPLRGHPDRAGLAVPQGPGPLLAGPLGAGGLVPDRAGLLPPAADRAAAADRRRLRRHPRACTPTSAGGAPTPRPPRGWASSPTSWPRSRACTPAGRCGWRSSYAATPTTTGCAAWPGCTPPSPRPSSSAPATTGSSTSPSAGPW